MQRALILSATLLAAGCSSTAEMPPVFSESFIANITPQGNHFFTYSATMNMQQDGSPRGAGGRPGGGKDAPRGGRGGGPGGGMGGGPGGGPGGSMSGGMGGGPGRGSPQKMRDNPEETAMERVEKIIADTGYCTNGWFVIEKTIERDSAEIRGECRTASG